jgi:outer membrane lipoprotein-sorting protein
MRLFIRLILFFIVPYISHAQTKINATDILRQAELNRIPWAEMSLYATLTDSVITGNATTSYRVFFNGNKALVECTEPLSQKGNLLLLQNDELWFYIKSTAHAMKITPIQRLSGSVSFVDIARLNWATDYSIDSFEIVKRDDDKKQEAYLLHLRAVSQEISYRKINLWVDKNNKKPIKADIYLSSEKIYKTLLFTKYQTIAGKEINTQIEFTDHFNKGRKSVINFSNAQQEKSLPENYFNKEKLPEVSKKMSAMN